MVRASKGMSRSIHKQRAQAIENYYNAGYDIYHDPRGIFTGCHFGSSEINSVLKAGSSTETKFGDKVYDDPTSWIEGCIVIYHGCRGKLKEGVYGIVHNCVIYECDEQGKIKVDSNGKQVTIWPKGVANER